MPVNDSEKAATENLCRIEFNLILFVHIMMSASGFLMIHVFSFFTAYHLPFDCYIIFLHPNELRFAWECNYLFMTITVAIVAIYFACYISLLLILINQSCWLLDMTVMTANKMNADLLLDEDLRALNRVSRTNDCLGELVERCGKFVEWRDEIQDLLQYNFNLEFQVQSLILCLSTYVLSLAFAGVLLVLVVVLICSVQLFAFCWMGSRVKTRIDQLSFEVSKNWYLMIPKQRKVLLMILHWTQSMKGFNGIFKVVSVETFKEVRKALFRFFLISIFSMAFVFFFSFQIVEASFSLYTFLKSTNPN